MSTYLLGIDVSTTATKALLIDDAGAVIAVAATEYPFETPQPLWTEQDAALFWDGTVQSVRAVLAKTGINPADIAGVGLSGQMHGLVTLDAAGQPLRPCILWNDQRTGAQCAEITARIGRERVLQLTGNPVLTGFTAPKVLWVQQNEPEIYGRIAHMLLPKDYVRYKLTGEFFSEVSDASGTSLFDVGQRRWSDEMLAALDIPRGWLPEVTESPVASARISAEAAAATGLVAGTPVVGGGGDQRGSGRGHGHCCGGHHLDLARHIGRRVRPVGRVPGGTGGPAARLLPRRAGQMASDGRDALGRGQLPLVSRRAGSEREEIWPPAPDRTSTTYSPPKPLRRRPAAKGCSSCRISPASARLTPTRSRAGPSSD